MTTISKDALICIIKDVIKERGKEPKDINFERSNGGYHGIIAQDVSDNTSDTYCNHVINVDYLYDEYIRGDMTISDITAYIHNALNAETNLNSAELMGNLMDWNKIKSKLFLSVCNITGNGEYLAGIVHEKYGDMAVVPRIFFFNDKQRGFGSSVVLKSILKDWNVSEDDIMKAAKYNSPRMFPAKFFNFHTSLFNIFAAEYDLPSYVKVQSDDMNEIKSITDNMLGARYILSTSVSNYGAAAMFYDGILDKIYEHISKEYINGAFYIMPISTYQGLIIPACLMDTDIHGLHMKLTNIAMHMNTVLGHDESDDKVEMSLYHYDGLKLTYFKRSL